VTRSAAQRQQDRDELLRVLEEQGPTMTGDLVAAVNGVPEVQPGSPMYTRTYSDIRALERQRLVMAVWVDRCFAGYALADQSVLDEQDDLADVWRQQLRWQEVDA
jgi:hypothetical protein